MFESLKNWNQERQLSPHERFIARVSRRIVENRKREAEGKPPKGLIIKSAEGIRHYPGMDPTVRVVPSAEWQGIDYGDLTEEDKQAMMAQVEPPPLLEVNGPNPEETFAMPPEGPPGWVRDIVARRAEQTHENHGD
jgi:hypothetical protein